MLDELGNLPFERSDGQLLFYLISTPYKHTSVIITSNLTFGEWPSVFGYPKRRTVRLDRITYQCDIVQTGTDSGRFKNHS